MKRLVFCVLLAACNGTTGSDLVTFTGSAGGASDVAPSLAFTTGSGWQVVLERAKLHVGAVYLNQNVAISGNADQPCVLPGIYVAQLFGPLDLDLLSPALVPFPGAGEGTETEAHTAEVWLLEGDINRATDGTVVLDVAGTATKDLATIPFSAAVTIGQNRASPPPNVAMPGANPICHRRIVTPIEVDILPKNGGTLQLRVDPRALFDGVDFSRATQISATPPAYVIPDEQGGIGGALLAGLHSAFGVYAFSWQDRSGP